MRRYQLFLSGLGFQNLSRLDPIVVPDVRVKMESVTIGNATLWHGDCLKVRTLLSGVDAVITDPPYGMGYSFGGGGGHGGLNNEKAARQNAYDKDNHGVIYGDDQPFDPAPWLNVGKVHIFWGANHFSDRLPQNSKWLVWDKIVVPETYGKFSFSDCEMAWTDIKTSTSARIYKQLWQGCRRAGESNAGGKLHPNRKPTQLMQWCIEQAGTPRVIVDPYMGSGTTGVAAVSMGLEFIGCEIERKYFDIACERIEAAQQQMKLAL